MSGWTKIHRKILKWEWYSDINTTRLFFHLIFKAVHKDTKYRGRTIKRGSLLTGRKILSKETGLTEQQVRTGLSKLKSTNEITIKTTSRYSIISLEKYGVYQDVFIDDSQYHNQQTTTQATNKQPTSNHIQEYKELKEDKKIRKKEVIIKYETQISELLINDFIDHRKTLKKPLTDRALELNLNNALKCQSQGVCSPDEAINHTIAAGWQQINPNWIANAKNKSNKKGLLEELTDTSWGDDLKL